MTSTLSAMLLAVLAFGASVATPDLEADGLTVSDPRTEGIDLVALQKLVDQTTKQRHSTALVILKNGKLVYEWYSGEARPMVFSMSAVRPLVGRLMDWREFYATLDQAFGSRERAPEWRTALEKSRALVRLKTVATRPGIMPRASTDNVWW